MTLFEEKIIYRLYNENHFHPSQLFDYFHDQQQTDVDHHREQFLLVNSVRLLMVLIRFLQQLFHFVDSFEIIEFDYSQNLQHIDLN